MPRVYTKTARAAQTARLCRYCGKEIEVGHIFHQWQKRYGGKQYCHVACGFPRPSWLSGRKTAVIEDMILDVSKELDEWDASLMDALEDGKPADSVEIPGWDDLAEMLSPLSEAANEVADEYEEGVDNLPESLQYGSQAEAMRDVAERLREWAYQFDSYQPNENTVVDLPDREEYDDDDSWLADAESIFDDAVTALRDEAKDALNSEPVPEYEG